jgi:hypothetical protein
MWPAEAFNLACETPIWFILLLPLIKTPFECVKTHQFLPLDMSKKNFWPAMRFELCTPDLYLRIINWNFLLQPEYP